jgi:hypothetical protein
VGITVGSGEVPGSKGLRQQTKKNRHNNNICSAENDSEKKKSSILEMWCYIQEI